MASTVITAPELHEETDDVIRSKLLEYVPMFRQHMDRGAGDLIGNLEDIIEHRLWSRVGYDSLDAYARECLQHSEQWCREIIRVYRQDWTPAQRATATVADLHAAAAETLKRAPDLRPTGRPPNGQDKVVSHTTLGRAKTGVSKDRLAARIKRDHPEIAAKVERGEYRSIRAAALDAGIVRPMKSVPIDTPEAAIRALMRVFSIDDLLRAVGRIADGA